MQMDKTKMHLLEQNKDSDFVSYYGLNVEPLFIDFIEKELLPNIDCDANKFWSELALIIDDFSSINTDLLNFRDQLQDKINEWCKQQDGNIIDELSYTEFLKKIGYIEPVGEPFQIETENVDSEISLIAAPQLVVPLSNARFAIKAGNARWGSLFDALYGSDVIPNIGDHQSGDEYNSKRGQAVIDYAFDFLDRAIPLKKGSHIDIDYYHVDISNGEGQFFAILTNGKKIKLENRNQFIGWSDQKNKKSLLFENNNLHIELKIDPDHAVGKQAPGNICDIILESAVTTIMDCEDSVAAVDTEDKVNVYRNWLGLMLGSLSVEIEKSGQIFSRCLNNDRVFTSIRGEKINLPGRALMLVRNVGYHMKTDMITDKKGEPVYEGILDAVITTACVLAGRQKSKIFVNSKEGSIYIVKPKIHGPQEAKLFDDILTRVEQLFDLPKYTIKVGLMDEERRTTCNLQECIRAIKNRVVFINTGFLDRTGDEIHTSMYLGPMCEKEKIKQELWFDSYEDQNVDIGIRCGFIGKAQIGKGMWAKPDEYKEMMETKIEHPKSGANCAWVPSPTAATLHAIHYHDVCVKTYQERIKLRNHNYLQNILNPPVTSTKYLMPQIIQNELDNNIHSILGYVVHWIDRGVGCSKVLDINNIYLMEDRATLRISCQHVANWLLHKVCNKEQVLNILYRMANYVDEQNNATQFYNKLVDDDKESYAFQATYDLIFQGCDYANGYTEKILHKYRKLEKIRINQHKQKRETTQNAESL